MNDSIAGYNSTVMKKDDRISPVGAPPLSTTTISCEEFLLGHGSKKNRFPSEWEFLIDDNVSSASSVLNKGKRKPDDDIMGGRP